MTKKSWSLLALLACFAVGIAAFFKPVARQSPDINDVQPSQLDTASTSDNPAPSPDTPRPDENARTLGVRDEPPPMPAGAHTPESSAQEQSGPTPRPVRSAVKTAAAVEAPGSLPGQGSERRGEAWTYPTPMQQSAATNFALALDRLNKAETEFQRYLALGAAAKSEYIFGNTEEARTYATELLALDSKFKGQAATDGGAVFDANLVLGRIAAQEGRLDEAKQYLLEAGKSTGSPVLSTFGPNMSLARDLLQNGERDVVLEYLAGCGNFWSDGQERLSRWSEDVKAGRMPDFGANLFY